MHFYVKEVRKWSVKIYGRHSMHSSIELGNSQTSRSSTPILQSKQFWTTVLPFRTIDSDWHDVIMWGSILGVYNTCSCTPCICHTEHTNIVLIDHFSVNYGQVISAFHIFNISPYSNILDIFNISPYSNILDIFYISPYSNILHSICFFFYLDFWVVTLIKITKYFYWLHSREIIRWFVFEG